MFTLEVKWAVSKARNTYGYSVCTMQGYKDNQFIKASCNGGGYDMLSTCLADAIMKAYPEKFSKDAGYKDEQIKHNYGMVRQDDGSYYLDGGCGTVERVCKDLLRLKISFVHSYNRQRQKEKRIAVLIEEIK